MGIYLTCIGVLNLVVAAVLLGAVNEWFADGILRRWTRMIPRDTPYTHGPHGRLWIWWAIIGSSFFASINLLASNWPPEAAEFIVIADVAWYSAFEFLAICGSLSGRFGSGMYVAHVLWVGQGGWGVYVLQYGS
jgi:hypothetical protein